MRRTLKNLNLKSLSQQPSPWIRFVTIRVLFQAAGSRNIRTCDTWHDNTGNGIFVPFYELIWMHSPPHQHSSHRGKLFSYENRFGKSCIRQLRDIISGESDHINPAGLLRLMFYWILSVIKIDTAAVSLYGVVRVSTYFCIAQVTSFVSEVTSSSSVIEYKNQISYC